jgi:hypothetical protein
VTGEPVHPPPLRAVVALALVAVLVAGCRLDLVATTELERDGTGVLSLAIRLDDDLLTELDELAIDPTVEVTALATELDGWTLDRTVDDEAGITITLSRPFERPSEAADALRAVSSGLVDADPALLIDLDLEVSDDGAARVDGAVAFRPPASSGAELDGVVLGPSRQELTELSREVVHPRVEITMPGQIERDDADRVEGRTLSWDVPIDGSRELSAASGPPGIHEQPWVWLVTAGVLVLVMLAWLVARRRT